MIVAAYDLVHISTGDLLREEAKRGTELGRKAKEFMDRGELVCFYISSSSTTTTTSSSSSSSFLFLRTSLRPPLCDDFPSQIPDELVISMVIKRLHEQDCMKKGWLLDGFPRTRRQALELQQNLIFADKFIMLDVPDQVVIERISGRRVDPVTLKTYHLKYNPPSKTAMHIHRIHLRSW